MFLHYEQRDQSSTFISPSDQGRNTGDNSIEKAEEAAVPVQEDNNQQEPIQQPVPEHQPSINISVPEKQTEASQMRRRTRSNLGHIFTTYV